MEIVQFKQVVSRLLDEIMNVINVLTLIDD